MAGVRKQRTYPSGSLEGQVDEGAVIAADLLGSSSRRGRRGTAWQKRGRVERVNSRLRLYRASLAGEVSGGAGENERITQAFQPDARLSAANSRKALKLR
jgi:hypothetical protein